MRRTPSRLAKDLAQGRKTLRAECKIAVKLAQRLTFFCVRPQVSLDLEEGRNFCTVGRIAVKLAHTRSMLRTKRWFASQPAIKGCSGRTVGRIAIKPTLRRGYLRTERWITVERANVEGMRRTPSRFAVELAPALRARCPLSANEPRSPNLLLPLVGHHRELPQLISVSC